MNECKDSSSIAKERESLIQDQFKKEDRIVKNQDLRSPDQSNGDAI